MRLSEIQNKEIINNANGKNLRHILDLTIDPETGKIISIVLSESRGFFRSFFSRDEIEVPWERIVKFGEDVVIIDYHYYVNDFKNNDSLL